MRRQEQQLPTNFREGNLSVSPLVYVTLSVSLDKLHEFFDIVGLFVSLVVSLLDWLPRE